MGLDNGIVAENIFSKDIPNFINLNIDDDQSHNIEVAYWRKCWGIRDMIIDILHISRNGGHYSIETEDLPKIIRGLMKFCSKEYWDENADSIWEFDDYCENIFNQILNLKWLYSYMTEHPEVTCYFYDSY